MAYTARKLITKAYYLSGIVSRDLQSITGGQATDGLDLLNGLLSVKSVSSGLIPYYQEYNFNAVAGQEDYFIDKLLEIETFTFYLDSVRFNTIPQKRKRYFGSSKAENISSLPFNWHYEREKGGSRLFLYFKPDKNYPLTIWGKFGLGEASSLDDDLSLIYDNFYIEYLRYALAEYICSDYGIALQEEATKKLKDMENSFIDISPMDLSMQKGSTLQASTGVSYGDVNIGHGWRP